MCGCPYPPAPCPCYMALCRHKSTWLQPQHRNRKGRGVRELRGRKGVGCTRRRRDRKQHPPRVLYGTVIRRDTFTCGPEAVVGQGAQMPQAPTVHGIGTGATGGLGGLQRAGVGLPHLSPTSFSQKQMFQISPQAPRPGTRLGNWTTVLGKGDKDDERRIQLLTSETRAFFSRLFGNALCGS